MINLRETITVNRIGYLFVIFVLLFSSSVNLLHSFKKPIIREREIIVEKIIKETPENINENYKKCIDQGGEYLAYSDDWSGHDFQKLRESCTINKKINFD